MIKNITTIDQGYWRLTSIRENDRKRGIAYIQVLSKIQLTDDHHGEYYEPLEEFTPENAQYCYVYRDGDSRNYNEEFPSHTTCKIPDTNLDPMANGLWNVKVGIAGQTDEVQFNINVRLRQLKYSKLITSVEKFTAGTTRAVDVIQLSCSFENFEPEDYRINFCRFKRVIDDYGLNMDEGQGKIKYNYHGEGIAEGQCGMMITQPDTADKALWKCYVGIESQVGGTNVTHTVGAILDASDIVHSLDKLTVNNVAILENQNLNILCESNIGIDYCWFIHPSGEKLSVTDDIRDDSQGDPFWYFGNGFMLGQCGITLKGAQVKDSGEWSCHVGATNRSQLELSASLDVRVTETNLVAQGSIRSVAAGDNLLIRCSSIPPNTPLEHCRFTLPSGLGFSINEQVTSSNPLAEQYFFNPNHDLKSGECSIIVRGATSEHHGTWTCAARLLGWPSESFDEIKIEVGAESSKFEYIQI